MATKTVIWCSNTVLSCVGMAEKGVVICLQDAALVVGGTVVDDVECAFLEALICSVFQNQSCPTKFTYTFSYDDEQLADPLRLILPTDITGAFCKNCLTDWVTCQLAALVCVEDSATIDFSLTEDNCITGDVKISEDADNIISAHADGLYATFADTITTLTADVGGTTTGTPVTLAGGTDVLTTRVGDTITIDFNGVSGVSSVTATDTTLTIAPNVGAVLAGINLSNANTWLADQSVPDEVYGVAWNGSLEVPTKNAIYDKIESLVTGVSSVGATAPITSTGGATPNISTSMNTNKLIGRGSVGIGVMEEITLGTNISLTGTTLNVPTGAGGVASVTANDTTLTISPTTGAVLAQINLTNANIWTGKQTVRLTTQQFTVGYDASNRLDFTINSTGSATLALTGTNPEFTLSNNLNVTGNIVPTGRVTKRTVVIADATSITPNIDTTDIGTQANTQAVGNLTVNAPTGTPANGQGLQLRIKSTNVQTFVFNAIYRASTDLPLPVTSTGATKTDYLCFEYNSADTTWDYVGKNFGF